MTEAAKTWWSQVRLVPGIGMKAMYKAHHQFSSISWFTKVCLSSYAMKPNKNLEYDKILMAWATTRTLGCAVSENCGNTWYTACHYHPG
ncbi:hypothetical protein OSTOST_11144 [Ostertagia ostertagi]